MLSVVVVDSVLSVVVVINVLPGQFVVSCGGCQLWWFSVVVDVSCGGCQKLSYFFSFVFIKIKKFV